MINFYEGDPVEETGIEDKMIAAGLGLHHISKLRHVRPRAGHVIVSEYAGRFGEGYRVYFQNPRSKKYQLCEYWVKPRGREE